MTFTYLMDYVRARTGNIARLRIETYDTGGIPQLQVKTTEPQSELSGPVLALDLGERLVGAAISDERLITTKRLPPLKRSSWKKLLQDVRNLIEGFDARTIVVGLPLNMDGTEGEAAQSVRQLAFNLARSVSQPVYLQDERLTSVEAAENLKAEGVRCEDIPAVIDGAAAALILRDFLVSNEERIRVDPAPNTGDSDTTHA
jgi:putative Holliday junction resolvase